MVLAGVAELHFKGRDFPIGELLTAGDRVTISAGDSQLYRIVHISEHRAWVSSLCRDDQRILPTSSLCLVEAEALAATH
jgi:hypothetical protein